MINVVHNTFVNKYKSQKDKGSQYHFLLENFRKSCRSWIVCSHFMFTGCCTGRSQSVYSLIIVAKISAWWYVYVLRTNSRRIFVRLSASIPYWASSAVKAKYASDRTTPIIKSYLRTYMENQCHRCFDRVSIFRVSDRANTHWQTVPVCHGNYAV